MDIDLNGLDAYEIIRILQMYPDGSLIIKQNRVYWRCSGESRQPRPRPQEYGPAPSGRNPTLGERSKRALDALGSMMGPPAR